MQFSIDFFEGEVDACQLLFVGIIAAIKISFDIFFDATKRLFVEDVFFKQLAGTFARRIVCFARPGDKGAKGDQCGIIKFGSRIDMYLPLDADIKVKIGDCVKACETVIAELK